ncbi:hypothetical protein [Marivita sp.]|uniref:hypothetical protein n=1 Tax=Marivita sp. TaxID=2003365 RepID=UPI003F6AEB2E
MRVASFQAAQDILLSKVEPSTSDPPKIGLHLSDDDPDWTDVMLNGVLVVQVPTTELLARSR